MCKLQGPSDPGFALQLLGVCQCRLLSEVRQPTPGAATASGAHHHCAVLIVYLHRCVDSDIVRHDRAHLLYRVPDSTIKYMPPSRAGLPTPTPRYTGEPASQLFRPEPVQAAPPPSAVAGMRNTTQASMYDGAGSVTNPLPKVCGRAECNDLVTTGSHMLPCNTSGQHAAGGRGTSGKGGQGAGYYVAGAAITFCVNCGVKFTNADVKFCSDCGAKRVANEDI